MADLAGPLSPDSAAVVKVLFGKYELGRLLGWGATAKVYHARDLTAGHTVAIKIIAKSRASKSGVTREVAATRRLRHPHILRLIEVLASRSKIYFVLELAKGGDLFSLIQASGRLTEDQARRYFRQLISAVGFSHSRGIFHRDLKPENLLLDESGNLKVSDFGLSSVFDSGGDPLRTVCGTPAYVAPEILARKGYGGAAVDLWSCGVVLFVMTAGYLPFNDRNLMNMYRKICRGDHRCPRWTSPELRRLIARLLDTDPDTRITVDDILKDRWFGRAIDGERYAAVTRHEILEENDKEALVPHHLNAFDLISFSTGFDLSGLFVESADRDRFVWTGPVEAILDRVEEVGRGEGLVVWRKKGVEKVVVEGRRGDLLSAVEVHRLTGELVVVEVEMCGGAEESRRWSGEFWRERLRSEGEPAIPVTGEIN